MSRFALKEPLVAVQRHMSSSPPRNVPAKIPNPPPRRHTFQSSLLARFDEELRNMHLSETPPRAETSNTMKVAMSGSEAGEMGAACDAEILAQEPLQPLFFQGSNAASTYSVPPQKPPHSFSAKAQSLVDKTPQTLGDLPREQGPYFPLYSYKAFSPGASRLYIRDETQANEAVSHLKGPLGFDLEWRVFFGRRMPERKTAVLQICDEQTILILQLTAMKSFPGKVKEVMESQDIIKMGVNILNDGRKLKRDYGIASAGLLELSQLAHLVDPARVTSKRMISLQRIVEMYTGHTLSKGSVRTSNWEANLSEAQLDYAANDAHSALKVYFELRRLAQEAGMVLKPVVSGTATVPAMGITFVVASPTDCDNESSRAQVLKSGSQSQGSSKASSVRSTVGTSSRWRTRALDVTSPQQLRSAKAESAMPNRPIGGQPLRAYKLWHEERRTLPDICSALRSVDNPLTKGTVITYVVQVLKTDTSLPFSRVRLRELAKLEAASWERHGWWIESLNKTDRGLAP